MEEVESVKFVKDLETNINKINIQIDTHKKTILNLEKEQQRLKEILHLEKAAFFSIDWLPNEIQDLDIYFPKKYHIARFLNYPYDYYVVKYDNFRFVLTDRLDFDRLDTFEITYDNYVSALPDIPLHIQIFYKEPERMFENIRSRQYLNDIPTSIANTIDILGANWSENMAFGIAIFYCWIVTHYIRDVNQYQTLHQIFGKYSL